MLCLRAAQVGNVVKQKALHRIGDELLQLPAGALQQDFLQRADFASHINGHADRSSYQKFLSLPLILLSVSRFFSKRNSFSAAILSVLRISMQEIQQNADKFLQLPAPCFSTVFQSPVFPKKCPSRRIWERHKYSQKFFAPSDGYGQPCCLIIAHTSPHRSASPLSRISSGKVNVGACSSMPPVPRKKNTPGAWR